MSQVGQEFQVGKVGKKGQEEQVAYVGLSWPSEMVCLL